MKNKNLLIIGAVVIAALFFFKKKKTATIAPAGPMGPTGPVLNNNDKMPPPPPPPPPPNDRFPKDMLPIFSSNNYPGGLTEGMRVLADDGVEQQLLENGFIWGLTYDQWARRGFDAATVVSSDILNQIPYGGTYNAGF